MENSTIVKADKLTILWTNADPITSEKMVMMYATNSRIYCWWDEVTVVIWGATAKLVAEDGRIQEFIKQAMHVGVKFEACIACANQLGVSDKLRELGIVVKGWGQPLTDILKGDGKLLTL